MTVLTLRQAAALLHVTPRTVYTWIRKFGLPHVRIGRTVRIPGHLLERWLEEQARRQAEADRRMEQFIEGLARKEGGAQ